MTLLAMIVSKVIGRTWPLPSPNVEFGVWYGAKYGAVEIVRRSVNCCASVDSFVWLLTTLSSRASNETFDRPLSGRRYAAIRSRFVHEGLRCAPAGSR